MIIDKNTWSSFPHVSVVFMVIINDLGSIIIVYDSKTLEDQALQVSSAFWEVHALFLGSHTLSYYCYFLVYNFFFPLIYSLIQ